VLFGCVCMCVCVCARCTYNRNLCPPHSESHAELLLSRRNNPNHFKEEAHPTSHPKVSELDLDDGSGNTVGGGGSGAGGGSGGDDRRFSSADEEHGEQEKKQARDK